MVRRVPNKIQHRLQCRRNGKEQVLLQPVVKYIDALRAARKLWHLPMGQGSVGAWAVG